MKKNFLTILILVLVAMAGGFLFKNNIIGEYQKFTTGLETFRETNIGTLVQEIKKDVFTPPPLFAGNNESRVLLTKAGIILETNLQRQKNSLPFLTENPMLSEAALVKANDMFQNQYFEHISPLGIDPGRLVQSVGYEYTTAGENLILGNFSSEKELVQAWMDSEGHRANILNRSYTEIGVAVIKGDYKGQTIWIGVQEFGRPLSICQSPSSKLKTQIDFYKTQTDQLFSEITSKKQEIDQTPRRSSEYDNLVAEYNEMVRQYQTLSKEAESMVVQYNEQVNAFNRCVSPGINK